MEQYRHGGEIYDKKIKLDFSVNTNPLGLPEGVKKALIKDIDYFSLYPDNQCSSLIAALAEYEQVDKNYIICGNGASDLIFRLCHTIKPKKALITVPAFSEYEKALTEAGCFIEYCCLSEQEEFQITEHIIEHMNETLDLMFLCSPNNPTGSLISPQLLKKIVRQCIQYDIFLVMDECFIDFIGDARTHSMKKYLVKHHNLFLLKAFTKFYAMAGLRLGYGLCSNRKLLERLQETGPAWNVSVPAQIAGLKALEEEAYRLRTKELISRERDFLRVSLQGLGLKVYHSQANYLFFKAGENLYEDLLKKGILIRQCANYHGLNKEYYRIAVKKHIENKLLVRAIQESMK